MLKAEALCAPPQVVRTDFELHRGEILGIAGLAGSGRTPLVRSLLGLEPFSSGSLITPKGRWAARRLAPSQQVKRGFGYLSEDRTGEGLSLPLSIADNVTGARLARIIHQP